MRQDLFTSAGVSATIGSPNLRSLNVQFKRVFNSSV
jgi:hypothetical protein